MNSITFADVVHQSVSFSRDDEAENLVLQLIDTPWFQRLRDISQTANTRLVYMFSEHSRFGHSLGVAYLAKILLEKLSYGNTDDVQEWRAPVLCAALLHDIGHLAPGSHTAFKTWFPEAPDSHENLGIRIIESSSQIQEILASYSPFLSKQVIRILSEDKTLPPWTWQIISGGSWNVDRGNWCTVDSVMAGVTYGQYNIPALVDSLIITWDGNLALRENRLDAMMHFMVSRHAMYRQIYQHRVLLASDMLNKALAQRARDLGDALPFADEVMKEVLASENPDKLKLESMFVIREAWWRYHLVRWMEAEDPILKDLSSRIINRRLFKTIRINEEKAVKTLQADIEKAAREAGFNPKYYVHVVSNADVHKSDSKKNMLVQLEDGSEIQLSDADPIFSAMSSVVTRSWYALPEEVKELVY